MLIEKANQTDQLKILNLEGRIFHDMEIKLLDEFQLLEAYYLASQEDRHTRYHFSKALVARDNQKVVGVLFGYPGKDEFTFDHTLQKILAKKYKQNRIVFPDRESFDNEWYIDSISVAEDFRGLGIGTELLKAARKTAIQEGELLLGLNVDFRNTRALKLYRSFGFRIISDLMISEHKYHHMQFQLT
ncbi:GNAT family N-acetyltransferase [Oenococcus oeni]|uniref:Acetyltransferase, GNAT family n=7 Tax=Oenococcus oeni TaxID=1247 RepID=Q04FL7_OENOB|nr:GNAT family N-acetyltransferase [Oenococcus oeni]EAV39832.1 acetyltransferase, GNAT family [Oenococcus oeni ATCC BAA-1163]KGH95138.1 acetyltransferase [Oenococcus oeni IOEB_S436a]ABJ56755.1 Acetyltransferase, GNAT family [Oenococcus oeni PSU-1]AWW98064.1 N-acetyltransferase [Oenococcus oeni]EJN98743.1 acetyltransferase [Oenococcus oeni AWRIB419]